MQYKLICTDIDGTLLNKDRELSAKTIQEIGRIKSEVPVILVSSRMPDAMRHLQKQLGIEQLPMIAYNGGLVLLSPGDQPIVFLSVPIDYQLSRIIHHRAKNTAVHVSLYCGDEWHVQELDYWAAREINNTKVEPTVSVFDELLDQWENEAKGAHKIMCMGPEEEIHAMEAFLHAEHSGQLNIYRSKATYLELSSKDVSKAVAIQKLLETHLGYTMEQAMAFGDNYNDIEMLEAVGWGVAMDNANETLKKVANEITLSNTDDGVAHLVEKYF